MRNLKIAIRTGLVCVALAGAAPGVSATPRELLTQAAFQTSDKAGALALVNQALAAAQAQLAANPHDREAQMQRGVGIGDRARLTRSPADAKMARQIFES